jgi:predicted flap endonuclease-1-like 5' DNA nuclease
MSSFLIGFGGGGLLGIFLVFLIFGRYREEADRRMRNLRTRVISLEIQRDTVAEELERYKAQLAEREADLGPVTLERERAEMARRKADRLAEELQRARSQLAELGTDRLAQELKETKAELAARERQLAKRELIVVIDHNRVNNLQAIRGIGPKLAETFIAEGIESLADLAEMTDEDLDKLAVQWPALASRIRREDWREQAAVLVAEGVLPGETGGQGDEADLGDLPAEMEESEMEYPTVVMG